MGGGAESLDFLSSSSVFPPRGFPEASVSPDFLGLGLSGAEFGWGGQQQLLSHFQISDNPLGTPDHFDSRIRTRNLSASEHYVPDLPEESFETSDSDLTNLELPFMNRRDPNMGLQPTFDVLNNRSLLSTGDVPQSPGLIESSMATPDLSPGPNLTQTPVQSPLANSQESQRFHCGINGCTKHYKRKHELKRHLKGHSGAKPHRCNVLGCNRWGQNGFVRRDHLRQHMKKVHGTDLL